MYEKNVSAFPELKIASLSLLIILIDCRVRADILTAGIRVSTDSIDYGNAHFIIQQLAQSLTFTVLSSHSWQGFRQICFNLKLVETFNQILEVLHVGL